MSVSKNNIVVDVARKSLFYGASGIYGTLTFNQGDLLCFSSTTHLLTQPTQESDMDTFAGVSVEQVVSGIKKSPFSDSNDASLAAGLDIAAPVYGVICSLILKSGDGAFPGSYAYGDPATGAQNVQASGTKPIGLFTSPAITGDGTLTVNVLVGARYPNDTLKF